MFFQFQNPEFFWLLILLPLLAWLKGRRGRSAGLIFSSTAIVRRVGAHRRRSPGRFLFFLRLLTLSALIIALARPQLGRGYSEIEASGIDIVLAVDLSPSMLALDFTEGSTVLTRLDVVKEVIAEFIKKRPNDRIGIVAFAENPYLVSPITLQHEWLETNLERLEVGLIGGSTAIGSAMMMSANRLRDLPSKSRVVILLTDGENNAGKVHPISAAEAAASYDIKVYTIAAGRGGSVPTYVLNRNSEIARDRSGRPIVKRMRSTVDESTLKEIADITDAQFFQAHNKEELKAIYSAIDTLEKTEVKLRNFAEFEELFIWPALLGLVLLGFEQALAQTRYRRLP